MSAYESFASVYDMFMDNIDYDAWCGYLTGILREYGISDGLVCELGCGTGSMTERLASEGYDMIGIDSSVDMLEEAQEKKMESGHDILYLNQDMREFELYGTVRAVVSVCDSMNYILTEEDLLKVFRLVNNYLDPGGVFVFDMNTDAKYRKIGDRTIAENRNEGSFIWDNLYDPDRMLNEYILTLFIPEDEETDAEDLAKKKRDSAGGLEKCGSEESENEHGISELPESSILHDRVPADGELCRKFEEIHVQRAYPLERIRKLLEKAGMIYVGAREAFTDHEPGADSERVYIIAKEHGKSWEN